MITQYTLSKLSICCENGFKKRNEHIDCFIHDIVDSGKAMYVARILNNRTTERYKEKCTNKMKQIE